MACTQSLYGLPFDCENSKGGIQEIWIGNFDNFTVEVDTDGYATITPSGDAKFKPFYIRKETGSLTSTWTKDEAKGIGYCTNELSLVFTKQDTAKRLELNALAQNRLACIVKDCNGVYTYLGSEEYVSMSSGSHTTGTARGDNNSYSIVLSDTTTSYPPLIKKEMVETVVIDLKNLNPKE